MVGIPDLNPSQLAAMQAVKDWFYRETNDPFKLGGLAGTGKSTLVPLIPEYLGIHPSDMLILAPTHAAKNVVKAKLAKKGIAAECRTIASLIRLGRSHHCRPCPCFLDKTQLCHDQGDAEGCCETVYVPKHANDSRTLVVVDEGSLVTEDAYEDLLRLLFNPKVLFIGDHGQLGAPSDNNFNAMLNPDVELDIPERAERSIINELAYTARDAGFIPPKIYASGVYKANVHRDIGLKSVDQTTFDFDDDSTILITVFTAREQPTNVAALNRHVRALLGRSGAPVVGDRVRAVRVDPKRRKIHRGMQGRILEISHLERDSYYVTIDLGPNRKPYRGFIAAQQFEQSVEVKGMDHCDLWEYGYAITCNKAQGSEWDNVVVLEGPQWYRMGSQYQYSRWLYTAITRAKRNLAVIQLIG